MQISFLTPRLGALFTSKQRLVKRYGAVGAGKIQLRLTQLDAADTLDDMRYLPGRCHELAGDRSGYLAVDTDHPYRLIFTPSDDPPPTKPDGGLDWSGVTAVTVVGVEDYH